MDAKIFYGDICGRDPLMTSPETIKRPQSTVPLRMNLPVRLKFNRKVSYRQEDFGGVVMFNDEVVFLNEIGFRTARNLISDRKFFDWRTVEVPKISDKEKEQFFVVLYDKKMLEANHSHG